MLHNFTQSGVSRVEVIRTPLNLKVQVSTYNLHLQVQVIRSHLLEVHSGSRRILCRQTRPLSLPFLPALSVSLFLFLKHATLCFPSSHLTLVSEDDRNRSLIPLFKHHLLPLSLCSASGILITPVMVPPLPPPPPPSKRRRQSGPGVEEEDGALAWHRAVIQREQTVVGRDFP
jgi:hypothetical protein